MARTVFLLTFAILLTLAFAEEEIKTVDVNEATDRIEEEPKNVDVEEATDRTFGHRPFKCPCKCFTHGKESKAQRQCWKRKFVHRCAVSVCKIRVHYPPYFKFGKWCCDGKHTTPPPTTTTTKPPPKCPCVCKAKHIAVAECYHKRLFCKLFECPKYRSHSHPPHFAEYKCCDIHPHH